MVIDSWQRKNEAIFLVNIKIATVLIMADEIYIFSYCHLILDFMKAADVLLYFYLFPLHFQHFPNVQHSVYIDICSGWVYFLSCHVFIHTHMDVPQIKSNCLCDVQIMTLMGEQVDGFNSTRKKTLFCLDCESLKRLDFGMAWFRL